MIQWVESLSTLQQVGLGLGSVSSWCIGYGMGIATKAYMMKRSAA